jgi:hypothetical protein
MRAVPPVQPIPISSATRVHVAAKAGVECSPRSGPRDPGISASRDRTFHGVVLAILLIAAGARDVRAGWLVDGVRLSTRESNMGVIGVVPDHRGGAIVAWVGDSTVSPRLLGFSVYAQRVTGSGDVAWGPAGIQAIDDPHFMSSTSGSDVSGIRRQGGAAIVADSSGGMFLTWETLDSTAGRTRIQRLSGDAGRQYGGEGVTVPNELLSTPILAPDGRGGVIVVGKRRAGYVCTHVDAAGRTSQYGFRIDVDSVRVDWMRLLPDGGRNATIVAWRSRPGRIWIRSLSLSAGESASLTGPAPLDVPGSVDDVIAVPDGPEAIVLVWTAQQEREYEVQAQRFGPTGLPLWPSPITVARGPDLAGVDAVSDGSDGAIVIWERNGSRASPQGGSWKRWGRSAQVWVQRVDSAGTARWKAAERFSSGGGGWAAVPDQAGGVILTWCDRGDVHARRLDGTGRDVWPRGAITVCQANDSQESIRAVSDGAGGIIAVWEDLRRFPYAAYAQRIKHDGTIDAAFPPGPPPDSLRLPAYDDSVEIDEAPVLEGVSGADERLAERIIQHGVEFGLLVDSRGRVVKTQVVRSVPGLDGLIRKWASQRWQPARLRCRPVASWVRFQFAGKANPDTTSTRPP